jgi:hypothetical protein
VYYYTYYFNNTIITHGYIASYLDILYPMKTLHSIMNQLLTMNNLENVGIVANRCDPLFYVGYVGSNDHVSTHQLHKSRPIFFLDFFYKKKNMRTHLLILYSVEQVKREQEKIQGEKKT